MTLRHRTVQRAGCEIHYWTGGSGEGPPVVFTHGATLDHRTWEPQIEGFAASHRILLWDVRGHGRSIPNRYHHPGRVSGLVALGCAGNTLPLSRRERLQAEASARDPRVREYVRDTASRVAHADMVAVMASLVGALHPEPGYRIDVPELLLHGEHDRLGNFRTAMPAWARRDPLARYLVVPDSAHLANQDNPAFFNDAVLRFLAEHGLDSPKD